MSHDIRHYPKFGHPLDLKPGWDLLDILADTPEERDRLVSAAERKHWRVWICEPGKRNAVLYKPHGAMGPWHDDATLPIVP